MLFSIEIPCGVYPDEGRARNDNCGACIEGMGRTGGGRVACSSHSLPSKTTPLSFRATFQARNLSFIKFRKLE